MAGYRRETKEMCDMKCEVWDVHSDVILAQRARIHTFRYALVQVEGSR